jgi:3-oxoisoapionate decarboxylase
MTRRVFTSSLGLLSLWRNALTAAGAATSRLGLAAFSCHQHWKAVGQKLPEVKFTDSLGFYDYVRALGGDGVQCSLRGKDAAFAKAFRAHVEQSGGYYEGDISLPKSESELGEFEKDVELAREAGAALARSVLTGSRRYETFKSLDEFREFQKQSEHRLAMVEPVLRKHRIKLAIENHKDHTAPELASLMRKISSEWVGVTVDTGNNIALLEEPQAVVEALAPFAFTVHLKDMAVQPHADGFLLSEIALGAGFLDLPRMIATLRKANPAIVFNIEMATRDPLLIPCKTDTYWRTFSERREADLATMLDRVKQHPPKEQPPITKGKSILQILADEEENNRRCLASRGSLL